MRKIVRGEGSEVNPSPGRGNSLSLDVGDLPPDLLHKDGQVVELVFVDVEGGQTGQVGELDVGGVLVPVQDQRAELL